MKKMMMALAALCVAGAASAVNVEWTKLNGGTGGVLSLDSGFQATMTQTITYAVVIPAGLPAGGVFLLGLSGVDDTESAQGNWNQVYVKSDGSGALKAFYKNASSSETAISLTGSPSLSATEASALAITVDRSNKRVVIYFNGTEIGRVTVSSEALFNRDMVKLAYGQSFGGSESWEKDYTIYAHQGTVTADDITVEAIPEPTALALLALGVAGLALRRKAA